MKLDGYVYKDSTDIITAVRIDKKLSFDTREWLTTDGTFNGPLKPTQEMLFYENDESTRLFNITLSYTETFIGNDIISYNFASGYGVNEELINSETIILSYKNLIIYVAQHSPVDLDMEETQNVALAVIDYLKKH